MLFIVYKKYSPNKFELILIKILMVPDNIFKKHNFLAKYFQKEICMSLNLVWLTWLGAYNIHKNSECNAAFRWTKEEWMCQRAGNT